MPGLKPTHVPVFPAEFLAQAQDLLRRRLAPFCQRQRAALACLLHREPALSHLQAARRVQLTPVSVRRWRRRWAGGDFTFADRPGRGRKPTFSPPGAGHRAGAGL